MESVDYDLLASCLALPASLRLVSLHPSATSLMVSLACRHLTAACPLCRQPSERIHSSYQRTIADVPCGGRRVLLQVRVRKFVCPTSTCPQQIFTERLPELVDPYARMTKRLQALMQSLGLVAGGEQGSRLAQRCGIQTSPSTLLRHLMRLEARPLPPVRVLGVDDWSWKKGHRYHAPHNLAKTVVEFSVCILRAPLRQRYGVAFKRAALHQNAGRESGGPQKGADI